MRSLFKGAVPLLAAAAFGLAHPAPAPCSTLPPRTIVAVEPEDEAPDLPHVVAPHRLVLEPLKEPSKAEAPPSAVMPAAATAADVDLLATPAGPSAWSPKAIQVKAPVASSGPPALPGVSTPTSKPLATAAQPSAPVQAPPATERRVLTRIWPTAFITTQEAPIAEEQPSPVRPASHVEKAVRWGPTSEADAPLSLDTLKQRVAAVCGGAATTIGVETKRNGMVFVKVGLRDAAANQATVEKIMEIPEMTAPNIHLLVEVER